MPDTGTGDGKLAIRMLHDRLLVSLDEASGEAAGPATSPTTSPSRG